MEIALPLPGPRLEEKSSTSKRPIGRDTVFFSETCPGDSPTRLLRGVPAHTPACPMMHDNNGMTPLRNQVTIKSAVSTRLTTGQKNTHIDRHEGSSLI